MLKRFVSTVILSLLALSFAHAQFVESVLFAAGSSLLNRKLADGDKRTISAIKPMCDIMVPDGKGGYKFTNEVWDPTTQTSVFMVDGLAFRVKSFKNGLPDRELKYYLNDALVAVRHIEADKGFDKKKGTKGQGIVGDYPIIDAKDICEGANQIKIVHNRQEIGSFTFVRIHSVRDVMNTVNSAEMREKLYGFGGASFPSVPTYVAQMPDGSIRSFISPEEMQLAFQSQTPSGAGNGRVNNPPDNGGGDKTPPAWDGQFRLGHVPRNWQFSTENENTLRGKTPQFGKHLFGDIPQDSKLVALLTADKPFRVALADNSGKVLDKREAVQTQDGHYELLIAVAFADGQDQLALAVSDSDNHLSILELTPRR